MVAMDEFASAFGFDAKSSDTWTTLGKVTAVSGTTLTVKLGGCSSTTPCEAYCLAAVDDIVFVVMTDGKARAVAVKGGAGTVATETTAANIITQTATQSTNYPITASTYSQLGKVVMLELRFQPSSAVSAGSSISLGTIASGKRPLSFACGGSQNSMGRITTAGDVQLVARSALSSSTVYTVGFTYLI